MLRNCHNPLATAAKTTWRTTRRTLVIREALRVVMVCMGFAYAGVRSLSTGVLGILFIGSRTRGLEQLS